LIKQFNTNLFIKLNDLIIPSLDNYSGKLGYIIKFLRSSNNFVNIDIAKEGTNKGVKLFIFKKIYNQAVISSLLSFISS